MVEMLNPAPKKQRWSRFPEQNGGLAKVDSGLDYAANFSLFVTDSDFRLSGPGKDTTLESPSTRPLQTLTALLHSAFACYLPHLVGL